VGRHSSIGIENWHAMDVPEIESQWGRGFLHPSSWPWSLPSLLYVQWVPGLFPRDEADGRSADHPPHVVLKLKKEQSYTSAPPLGLNGRL